MVIEQSGNMLYVTMPRKNGKIEIVVRRKNGHVKERIGAIPAGILWIRFKPDGITTFDNSYSGGVMKIEVSVPLGGSVKLVDLQYIKDFDPGEKIAIFSWNDDGTLVFNVKNP